MAVGMIVNAADARYDRWEDRDQEPCFVLDDGTLVFEVWIWHSLLQRWFCMTNHATMELITQGVVCFRPADVPDRLREQMSYLERQAGIER